MSKKKVKNLSFLASSLGISFVVATFLFLLAIDQNQGNLFQTNVYNAILEGCAYFIFMQFILISVYLADLLGFGQ